MIDPTELKPGNLYLDRVEIDEILKGWQDGKRGAEMPDDYPPPTYRLGYWMAREQKE